MNSTDGLTAAQATAYNATVDKAENGQLTAEQAAAYNATLTGAKAEGDLKSPAEPAEYQYKVIIVE